jgi:hypothetical protein
MCVPILSVLRWCDGPRTSTGFGSGAAEVSERARSGAERLPEREPSGTEDSDCARRYIAGRQISDIAAGLAFVSSREMFGILPKMAMEPFSAAAQARFAPASLWNRQRPKRQIDRHTL